MMPSIHLLLVEGRSRKSLRSRTSKWVLFRIFRIWANSLVLQTLFIESACDDEKIIEENVRSVKISSPDVCSSQLV